jgi:hypothetical protein
MSVQVKATEETPTEAVVHMKLMEICPIKRVRPFENYKDGYCVTLREDWVTSSHREAMEEEIGMEINTISISDEGHLQLFMS